MKLVVLTLFACISTLATAQQKITIKSGTVIPIQAQNSVKAADVNEGDVINFSVISDIKVDGIKVIEKGALVKGKVVEARKSTIAGTKGRLAINLTNMTLPNGDPLYFTDSTIRICGKNKTPLAVITALFVWPCIFIPGSKAVLPAGYETTATVASNTEVIVK